MRITSEIEKRIDEMAAEMKGDSKRPYKREIFNFVQDSSPMAPSNKEPWLQALRSGEYTKHRRQLASIDNDSKRCCLGVAYGVCSLPFLNRSKGTLRTQEAGDLESGFMGLDIYTQEALASLNDGYFTHSQIADLIEEFL